MAKVREKDYRLCFTSGMVSGFLIGLIALTILVSHRMDEYYKSIVSLENIITDQKSKLEKLEERISTSNFVLRDIEIILSFNVDEIDEIDKIDIEKSIKEKYTSLLGKEVHSIDVDILSEVIDKRIFKLDKKEYSLKVDKVVLTETLKIYVHGEVKD